MSGETEESVSGWTVDTLQAHFHAIREDDLRALAAALAAQEKAVQAALISQEKAVAAAMAASEKAIDKADIASEKRLDSVNEFRAQQADVIARFMPRDEALAIVTANQERISSVNQQMERRLGELVKELDKLDKRMDLREGRSGGLASGWGYLIAAIGAVVLLVNLGIYAIGH